MSKKCTKKRAARAARLLFLIQHIKSLICRVVVVVAVRLHSLNLLLTLMTVRALDRESVVRKMIVLTSIQQMVRIGQSLEKYRDAKLQQFRNQLPSENSHVSFPFVNLLRDLLWSFKQLSKYTKSDQHFKYIVSTLKAVVSLFRCRILVA